MKKRELLSHGVPAGKTMDCAIQVLREAAEAKTNRRLIKTTVTKLIASPEDYIHDGIFGQLAQALIKAQTDKACFIPRIAPAHFEVWGDEIEESAKEQMRNACNLPVSVKGALMPDAHLGYGLPIGGVLATKNAVIPYGVGMDIACRMKLTVLDLPSSNIRGQEDKLKRILADETRFGVGAAFVERRQHAVMDEDWTFCPVIKKNRDRAWKQLGSSGSGNHFVEFGTLTLEQEALNLKPGVYFALLSHSGSRGTGGDVASFYSRLAMDLHPELPRELMHLAWLELDSEPGHTYWQAMELMGRYAAANHELIHSHVAKRLGATVLADIENHHNFAWKETHFGEEVIVHRKGATPAHIGQLGIIPGSMATPGYVVSGKAMPNSLHSASHGAGRKMSRTATRKSCTWNEAKKFLNAHDVVLISAGLDEVPMGYKDIETVMAAQADLIEIVARFDPKLVKMAPSGKCPEN